MSYYIYDTPSIVLTEATFHPGQQLFHTKALVLFIGYQRPSELGKEDLCMSIAIYEAQEAWDIQEEEDDEDADTLSLDSGVTIRQ
ncbi:hypothetical protein CVT25_013616 [Psilocybe cyanescens]|uniref:Uncharacterized protein n=1 Tax=Psilocybe cyanescens TaxID=93625 RepID=A0A409W0I1_PSICY|nr:hypothetical protein CVT25_013616 [Psilocybe cyanescens]